MVDTNGFDVKYRLHRLRTMTMCVGREIMGEDVGDYHVFSGVETDLGTKVAAQHLPVEDICVFICGRESTFTRCYKNRTNVKNCIQM